MNGDRHPPSYYRASAAAYPPCPELSGDRRADVIIVGAGYTGLSAALELAQAGYDVAVVEAGSVGHGASGRNGGHLCTGFTRGMDEIRRRLGDDGARLAWEIADAGPKLVAARCRTHAIACDLKWGYLHAAERPGQLDGLRHQLAEWAQYGYAGGCLLTAGDLESRIGTRRYCGALWEPGAGHLHPLNYCIGLARAAQNAGARIYEHSPARQIVTGDRPELRTDKGRLSGDFLIIAGNAYLGDTVPYLQRRLMPVGSYILATEPLGEALARSLIRHDEAVVNCNFIVDYYRLSADHRLLFGGRATYSGREPASLKEFVRPRMVRVFPQLSATRLDYAWGGHIGITADRTPHLGRIGTSSYFAQGYSGHGVALSNMCGKLLADAVRGQAERFDLLARLRHPVFPGGRLRAPLLALAMLWYRVRDAFG